MIGNPEYAPDEGLYERGTLGFVGFELWQVTSGATLQPMPIP